MTIVAAVPALGEGLSLRPRDRDGGGRPLQRLRCASPTRCWWSSARLLPALTVDPTFFAGSGVGQDVGEDVLGVASGSTVGFQVTDVTATGKAVVRNDGRFATLVRGNSSPPDTIVRFLPSGRAGQDGTSTVRLAPGARPPQSSPPPVCAAARDDRGTVVPLFGLSATTFGLHEDTSASNQIVFDAPTLPPASCLTPHTT